MASLSTLVVNTSTFHNQSLYSNYNTRSIIACLLLLQSPMWLIIEQDIRKSLFHKHTMLHTSVQLGWKPLKNKGTAHCRRSVTTDRVKNSTRNVCLTTCVPFFQSQWKDIWNGVLSLSCLLTRELCEHSRVSDMFGNLTSAASWLRPLWGHYTSHSLYYCAVQQRRLGKRTGLPTELHTKHISSA